MQSTTTTTTTLLALFLGVPGVHAFVLSPHDAVCCRRHDSAYQHRATQHVVRPAAKTMRFLRNDVYDARATACPWEIPDFEPELPEWVFGNNKALRTVLDADFLVYHEDTTSESVQIAKREAALAKEKAEEAMREAQAARHREEMGRGSRLGKEIGENDFIVRVGELAEQRRRAEEKWFQLEEVWKQKERVKIILEGEWRNDPLRKEWRAPPVSSEGPMKSGAIRFHQARNEDEAYLRSQDRDGFNYMEDFRNGRSRRRFGC